MKDRTKSSNTLTVKCDQAHVEQVFRWILAGATEYDIDEAVRTAWPDVNPAPPIVEAIAKLREAGAFDQQVVFGWCFEATRDLYRRMVDIGDFPGALRAIKQLADLTKRQPDA